MPTEKKILLCSHYSHNPGMFHKWRDYLISQKWQVGTVLHPLYPSLKQMSSISDKKKKKTFALPAILPYVLEAVSSSFFWKKEGFSKYPIAICFDPLSFWSTYLFRPIYGVRSIAYYSLDFSLNRFHSPIMNSIYNLLNRGAFGQCSLFLSPTTEMAQIFDPLSEKADSSLVIPHMVNTSLPKKLKRNTKKIVFAGSLSDTVWFTPFLEGVKKFSENNPQFVFQIDIFGDGRKKDEIVSKIENLDLNSYIHLHGVVENKELIQNILPKYVAGIAPYALPETPGAPDHMFRGTDLTSKIVEYFSAGLPVVAAPIYKAFDIIESEDLGFLCKTSHDWEKALESVFFDSKKIVQYRKNVIHYAKKYDAENILKNILQKLEN